MWRPYPATLVEINGRRLEINLVRQRRHDSAFAFGVFEKTENSKHSLPTD